MPWAYKWSVAIKLGFKLKIRDAQMQLRQQAASQNPLPTRQAISNVRENMPFEALVAGPSSLTMARNYRNYLVQERGERGDDQLDLADTAQIALPVNIRNNFVFDGFVDGLRMLVFVSDSGKNILAHFGQHAAIDGTFKCAPNNFVQLYTISALVDKVAIPCVYGILRSKSENTYFSMFRSVTQHVPDWHPETFMMDFESSAINAVTRAFPNSDCGGCLFHFAQSVYRKLQRLPNLYTQFLENEQQRIKIKSLFALAFVPPGEPLYNHFCLLLYEFPNNLEVEELMHYFVINWIGCQNVMEIEPIDEFDEQGQYGAYGYVDQHIRNWIDAENNQNRPALFPMNIWNMCERLQEDLVRTNNSVEAWHRTLNALFRSQSPRLSEFLRVIRNEDDYWQRQMAEFEINPAFGIRGKGMKRKQIYVEQDANLQEIFATRANRHPLQYLRAIAYRMPDPL